MTNEELVKVIRAILKIEIIHKDASCIYVKFTTPSGTSQGVRIDIKDLFPKARQDITPLPVGGRK